MKKQNKKSEERRKGGQKGERMWRTHRLETGAKERAVRPARKPAGKFAVRRIYDKAEKADGFRVLIDRLWPRGVSKREARIDIWAEDAAPSAELRQWFHAGPEKRYASFSKKYAAELKKNPAAKALKAELRKAKPRVTLLTAAKDVEHSHAPILLAYLKR